MTNAKVVTAKNPNLVIDDLYARREDINDLYVALYGADMARHYKQYMDAVIQKISSAINAGASEQETYQSVYVSIEEDQKNFESSIEGVLAAANSQGEILDIGMGPTHDTLVSLGAKLVAGADCLAVLES